MTLYYVYLFSLSLVLFPCVFASDFSVICWTILTVFPLAASELQTFLVIFSLQFDYQILR